MDMSRFAVEGGKRPQYGVGEWWMLLDMVMGIPCPCQRKQDRPALKRAKFACLGMDTAEEVRDSTVWTRKTCLSMPVTMTGSADWPESLHGCLPSGRVNA